MNRVSLGGRCKNKSSQVFTLHVNGQDTVKCQQIEENKTLRWFRNGGNDCMANVATPQPNE